MKRYVRPGGKRDLGPEMSKLLELALRDLLPMDHEIRIRSVLNAVGKIYRDKDFFEDKWRDPLLVLRKELSEDSIFTDSLNHEMEEALLYGIMTEDSEKKTQSPRGMADLVWPDMFLENYKKPRKFRGGLTKRDLAHFLRKGDYEAVRLMLTWVDLQDEGWRMLFIHQMHYEMAGQRKPTPSWLRPEQYRKVRWRTMAEREEELDYDDIFLYKKINGATLNIRGEEDAPKPKKTRAQMRKEALDKKYRALTSAILLEMENQKE